VTSYYVYNSICSHVGGILVAAVYRRKLTYAFKLLLFVELHTSRNTRSANNFWTTIFVFSQFYHVKYTSNMAACYDSDVSEVTAPHV